MSLDTRLERMMTALSGKERAIIVLRDFKASRPTDPSLVYGISSYGAATYNRLIDLMNTCNRELLTMITLLWQLMEELELRLSWLASVQMLAEQTKFIVDYLKATPPVEEGEKRAHRSLLAVQLKDLKLWRQIAQRLTQTIRTSLESDWDELVSLETVLEQLAEDFDGEDLLKPIIRGEIDKAREIGLTVHKQLQLFTGEFDLPQPSEETKAQIREWILTFPRYP